MSWYTRIGWASIESIIKMTCRFFGIFSNAFKTSAWFLICRLAATRTDYPTDLPAKPALMVRIVGKVWSYPLMRITASPDEQKPKSSCRIASSTFSLDPTPYSPTENPVNIILIASATTRQSFSRCSSADLLRGSFDIQLILCWNTMKETKHVIWMRFLVMNLQVSCIMPYGLWILPLSLSSSSCFH